MSDQIVPGIDGYGIYNPDVWIVLQSIRRTKEEAIEAGLKSFSAFASWEDMMAFGWRCIPVTIRAKRAFSPEELKSWFKVSQ